MCSYYNTVLAVKCVLSVQTHINRDMTVTTLNIQDTVKPQDTHYHHGTAGTVNACNAYDTPTTQPDKEETERYLYALQLAGIAVYLVKGGLVVRGTKEKKTLDKIKQQEAEITRHIEETTSLYWLLYTIDSGGVPVRFKEAVSVRDIKRMNTRIISAMPCRYEAGLFDVCYEEVFK